VPGTSQAETELATRLTKRAPPSVRGVSTDATLFLSWPLDSVSNIGGENVPGRGLPRFYSLSLPLPLLPLKGDSDCFYDRPTKWNEWPGLCFRAAMGLPAHSEEMLVSKSASARHHSISLLNSLAFSYESPSTSEAQVSATRLTQVCPARYAISGPLRRLRSGFQWLPTMPQRAVYCHTVPNPDSLSLHVA